MTGEKEEGRQKEKLPKATSFAVYIHIPFCEKKCGYCDFVSFCDRMDLLDSYVDALCREIEYEKTVNKENGLCCVPADTVFIGGGTPSLLTNTQINRIFECLDIKPNAEITIEANPNSITAEKLRHWIGLGINRISIGVQSFDDVTLKKLGRIHSSFQAMEAIMMSHDAGFSNINIDLMHSIPDAPLNELVLKECFDRIKPFIAHVSAYSLIIESGTPFSRKFAAVDDKQSIEEQKKIESMVEKFGFKKYEVSNFAKSGFKCRHNQAYWMPHKWEYKGFGLGAHSLIKNKRFSNTCDLDEYINQKDYFFKLNEKERTGKDLITEIIMLGLRTVKGVPLVYFNQKQDEIRLLVKHGLVKNTNGHISATTKGFNVLNMIIERLVP